MGVSIDWLALPVAVVATAIIFGDELCGGGPGGRLKVVKVICAGFIVVCAVTAAIFLVKARSVLP